MNTELQYLEALCKQLYESTDPTERNHAEKALAEITERSDCIAKCMMLLEQSNIPYSQLVASNTLTKVISRQTVSVTVEEKLQIKEYLLQHLATHTSFPSYVITALCQLFARLTKLSWFDLINNDFVFQSSIPTIIGWVEQNQVQVCLVGVQLLVNLTAEMNQQDGVSGISRHRKIAGSFRDSHLYDVFQLSLRLLQQALAGITNFNFSDEAQRGVLNGILQLTINVLNYDFLGTVIDDSSDDNVTVQIPASWRPAFDSSIIKMCFDLYMHLPTDLGALVLTCLVHLTSVRRTVFTAADRQVYLTEIISGIGTVLANPLSLNDQSTYHEFCRLIARLKSNFQLVELTKVEGYANIVRRLAEFTTQSLQMPQFSANSVHYLLIFWHRMISSMPYVKPSEPHFIEQYAPLIAKTFIESRINMVSIVARDGIDDPLDDQSTLIQQMEQFSIIGRCEYDKTCQLLKNLFDQYASDYQRAVATSDQLNQRLEEWRLTWMIYLIGAAVGGRQASNVSDEHDIFDGDLICRALELMRLTDSKMVVNIRANEKLEMSYLWFLEQFRKIYISDQVQKSSKVFTKLTEILHLVDEASILALIVQKIINNLKYWGHNEAVVDSSLSLFNDLSLGYSSVRRLIRLPEIQYLITHHTPEEFSFLGPTADLKTMHCRTTFYSSLSRLLCVEMGEDEGQFERFMAPLTNTFNDLVTVFNATDSSLMNLESAKKSVIGLARSIRGVAFSCTIKTSYIMLFDWLYPTYLEIFKRAVEIWYSDPVLTTPVLKFISELCQNRSGRLQFDVSSPNSILLFKECSKFVVSYGSRILNLQNIPKDQLYKSKLKGLSICLSMLRAALGGGYVNFGVLHLYGDHCLDDALNIFIKMVLSIPQSDILAYTKLSHNYYFLLESLMQDHMVYISHLEPQIIVYLLQTILDGLSALDTTICTCCCSTLDSFVTHVYKRGTRTGAPAKQHAGYRAEGNNILRIMDLNYDVLRQLLTTIMNTMIYEDCRCQWSLSRPLLGLVLLHEDYFGQLKNQIISAQATEKQPTIANCFNSLMDGIERNLSAKNKDRFTQNVSIFRRDIMECLKGPFNTAESSRHNLTDAQSDMMG